MNSNKPLSEQWYDAAKKHADLESAASLLEESKSAVLSQRMQQLGDMPVSRAEMTVKASDSWQDYITQMVRARTAANLALVEKQYLKMKFEEWTSAEANHRVEAKL